jgi:hypothetical protein
MPDTTQKKLARTLFFFMQFCDKSELQMQTRADDVAEVMSTWATHLPDVFKFMLLMHHTCDKAEEQNPDKSPDEIPVTFSLDQFRSALIDAMPLDKVDNLLSLLHAANRNMNKSDDT